MIRATTSKKNVPRRAFVPLLACKQCKTTRVALRTSSLRSPASGLRALRPGFTLTELLVVITIIGMLAGMSLGALYAARETARVQKTKGTISKLDRIIQERYAEFFTRRLPITGNRRIPPGAMAELKFRVLYEIIRTEMPDRISDITWPRDPANTSNDALDMIPADGNAMYHPAASFAINSRTQQVWVDVKGNLSTSQPSATAPAGIPRSALAKRYWRQVFANPPSTKFDSAECLYLVVMADPDAREMFQPNEIGDADDDGYFEFHDAWDRPIMFLRWAPGFVGESDVMTAIDDDNDPSTPMVGDPEGDPDPMNPSRIGDLVADADGKFMREGNRAMFRLVPLIYSGGPDKTYGISPGANSSSGSWRSQLQIGDSISKVWIDGADIGRPFNASDPPSVHDEIGTHHDNIHNHSLGMN